MPSPQYLTLKRQVALLGRALLPRDVKKDLLEFTPRISVRALSYRILCHAELEAYLEARSLEILAAADRAWKERKHISMATLCMLAFSGRQLDRLPETLKAPPKKKDSDWDALIKPDKRISDSISEFYYYLRRQNNGIKEENLVAILLRVGLSPDVLDAALVADMDDLGSKRGEVAHGGAAGYVTRGVNPRDEYEHVKRVIDNLKVVDDALTALLKAAR